MLFWISLACAAAPVVGLFLGLAIGVYGALRENDWCDWENDEAKRQAIETDSIWTLQWYPDTPVGFYAVAAPTLTDLLRIAGQEKP